MDLTECIRSRRSVRNFTEQSVDREILQRVVADAAFAPSWKNGQIARYIAVEDSALKCRIAENCVMGYAKNGAIIRAAPLLVVMTYVINRSGFDKDAKPSTSKGSHWESFDAGIAAQTFCLAAWNAGLGSVILGIIDEEKLIETIAMPADQKVAALIAVGYPAQMPEAPHRKDACEILTFR